MAAGHPCVAVVDDEAPVLTALGRLLRLEDYEVKAFSSGEEFLASLQAWRPDCVILDVNMPRSSGFDVQSGLRALHLDIPVLFITASDDPALDRAVSEAGGVQLLRKPFSNARLLGALRGAVGSKGSEPS